MYILQPNDAAGSAGMPTPQTSAPPAGAPIAGGSSSLLFDDLFPAAGPKPQPKVEASSHVPVDDDPFAAFGAVDGAMPVVASTQESNRPNPTSSSSNLLGLLEDHLPLGGEEGTDSGVQRVGGDITNKSSESCI
jgi:hypothetical protein